MTGRRRNSRRRGERLPVAVELLYIRAKIRAVKLRDPTPYDPLWRSLKPGSTRTREPVFGLVVSE